MGRAQSGLDGDPVVRHHLAELAVEVAEVEALTLEMLQAVQDGRSAVVEAACEQVVGQRGLPAHRPAGDELGAPEALVRGTRARVPVAPDDVGDDRRRDERDHARPDRPQRVWDLTAKT